MVKRLKSSKHKKHPSKTHVKGHVKKHTRRHKTHRKVYRRGGVCSNGYSIGQSLMQGQDYEAIHTGQHGGEGNSGRLSSNKLPGESINSVNNKTYNSNNAVELNGDGNAQIGGMYGPYPSAVTNTGLLSPGMEGPAMTSGTMAAYGQITGMTDPTPSSSSMLGGACGACGAFSTSSTNSTVKLSGGRKHKKTRSKHNKRRKSHKHGKRKGGMTSLHPMSLPMQGLLLNPQQYTEAGLNPEYTGAAVEYTTAKTRNST